MLKPQLKANISVQ